MGGCQQSARKKQTSSTFNTLSVALCAFVTCTCSLKGVHGVRQEPSLLFFLFTIIYHFSMLALRRLASSSTTTTTSSIVRSCSRRACKSSLAVPAASDATAAYDQTVETFPSIIIGPNKTIVPQGSFAKAQAQVRSCGNESNTCFSQSRVHSTFTLVI